MIPNSEGLVQALDASIDACLGSWPKAEADAGPGPDLEVVLESSSELSMDASSVFVCTSSSNSSCSSGECAQNPTESQCSSSAADLAFLSGFYQRDAHHCLTSDGWKLHIMHVYDSTAEATTSGRQYSSSDTRKPHHPVLMIPGLASSGKHTFDLLPEYSLVNALVAKGYDVWVADLRGNGRSQKPSLLDSSTWWTVDDHFLQDVPAVLEYVLQATGAKQVHWVGHSMGGMLAVGLQSQRHELAGAVRSITMMASGCFGSGSWHSTLKPFINCITGYGFPAGFLLWALSLLTGTATALLPFEALFFWPSNMSRAAARELLAKCFHFIPAGVIRQFMGSLNSPQGLSACDGSFRYADPQALQQVDVPVLALNGTWDLFCPPAGGRKTLELFGSQHKQFVCIGPSQGTGKRNYGHFDIVSGKDAAAEVYPYVLKWLEQHDSPLGQQDGTQQAGTQQTDTQQ